MRISVLVAVEGLNTTRMWHDDGVVHGSTRKTGHPDERSADEDQLMRRFLRASCSAGGSQNSSGPVSRRGDDSSRSAEADPSDVEILYRLGYVQFRERKLAAARTAFAQVVRTAPPAWYSRYFLGRICLLENKPREAVTWLEPIVAASQPVFDTPVQIASAYAGAGLNDKAIPAIRMAIAATPWDASLQAGAIYQQTGNKELPGEAFETGACTTPVARMSEPSWRYRKHSRRGARRDAKDTGTRIMNRQDADPNALVALGVLYGGANLSAEALDAFDRAAARNARFLSGAVQSRPCATEAESVGRSPGSAGSRRRFAAAVGRGEPDLWTGSGDESAVWGGGAALRTRVGSGPWQSSRRCAACDGVSGRVRRRKRRRCWAPKHFQADDPATLLLRVEALSAAEEQTKALDAAMHAEKKFPQLPQTHMAVGGQLSTDGTL